MNLQGSIKKLQKVGINLYIELEQYFSENKLIRDFWKAMAQDVMQQSKSLHSLPRSFWNRLHNKQNSLGEAIHYSLSIQTTNKKEDKSLKRCFLRTYDFEEPTILKVYAPLIRYMRKECTGQALDFYIMVKAHLARTMRITEAFGGNPLFVQRSSALLQCFEKEVQMPQAEEEGKGAHGKTQATRKSRSKKKTKAKLRAKIPKRARPRRTKSLFEKIDLRRRRVRR